ncbi:MAG TPA: universal stress protein [Candidatus Glassbacteria bacterium]|nr:universal stress protein [Candidatus Glassbacteria bacterium]
MSDISVSFDSAFVGAPGDKILLPLLGYPAERDAMFIALVTAEYFGSSLHVFHLANKSIKTETYFHEQLEWLKEEAKTYNVELDIVIKEANGKVESAILTEIHEVAPKLTIMMTRKKGLFQRLSGGSIAERIARKSPHSVIIIRSPIKDWITYGTKIDPRKIVVPIGTNMPCEVCATQIAIAIANAGAQRDAQITLLHVIVVPETVPIITEDDEMLIQEEKRFVKLAGQYSTMLLFPMNTQVVVGRDIGRSVRQFVNKEHADLVVMGVPYLPRRVLGLYGTDTKEISYNSKCPVLMLFHKNIP